MRADKQDKPYHHGDLRRALLDAGLQLIAKRGVEGFTLREVARQAGVSHNAPYMHFTDRAALVEALAVEGFNRLTQILQTAVNAEAESPLQAFLATGRAYVQFALTQPAMFRLMYRPELRQTPVAHHRHDQDVVSALDVASRAGYQVLIDCIQVCQQADVLRPGDAHLFALTAWATVHGLATLLLDGAPGGVITTDLDTGTIASMVAGVTTTLMTGVTVR